MNKADIIVIGAGVVGLAITHRLSSIGKKIILLERHSTFGQDASTRNSEVIHGGMYYPTAFLKARICVEGNRMLYEICSQNDIACKKTGKLITANTDDEINNVEKIYRQGLTNHVPGLRIIDEREIKAIEPNIRARYALYSPETGILDVQGLMQYLETASLENSVDIRYDHEVIDLAKNSDGYFVTVKTADGGVETFVTDVLINAAGMFADRISALLGIDIDGNHYKIYWVKGEYFNISKRHAGKITHLVYPTPTTVSLGIHVRLRFDGTMALGPSAIYVDEINYDVDPAHVKQFYEEGREYLPFLEYADLSPDISGIRAKRQAQNEAAQDFIIRNEGDKGLPGFINLVGIDSPGLTACPAIAEMVADIYRNL